MQEYSDFPVINFQFFQIPRILQADFFFKVMFYINIFSQVGEASIADAQLKLVTLPAYFWQTSLVSCMKLAEFFKYYFVYDVYQ